MVSIFVCCEQGIYKYMEEYIRSFLSTLGAQLLVVNIETYQYNNDNVYIFIQKVPVKLLKVPLKRMYLLNTEQTTIPKCKAVLTAVLKQGIKVIDYSRENIGVIGQDVLHMPYQFNETEITNLKRHTMSVPKQYDVIFVGFLSEKRKKVYDALVEKGVKMLNINEKWHGERDKLIGSAKVLLNVHFSNDSIKMLIY